MRSAFTLIELIIVIAIIGIIVSIAIPNLMNSRPVVQDNGVIAPQNPPKAARPVIKDNGKINVER